MNFHTLLWSIRLQPQCLPSQFTRSILLWHSANARQVLGQHNLKKYETFKLPPAEQYELKVPSGSKSLDRVISEDLGPGQILLRDSRDSQLYEFCDLHPYIDPPLDSIKKRKGVLQMLKEIYLYLDQDQASILEHLRMMYRWLSHDFVVEVHVRRSSKNQVVHNKEAFNKMLRKHLHLRPDVILSSMPLGSGIVVDTQTDWLEYCWVIGPPEKKKDGTLQWPRNITDQLEKRRDLLMRLNADPKERFMLAGIEVRRDGCLKEGSLAFQEWAKYKMLKDLKVREEFRLQLKAQENLNSKPGLKVRTDINDSRQKEAE